MKPLTPLPKWIGVAILACALVAAYPIFLRHRVETRARATSIALESDAIRQAAAADGLTFKAALERLKIEGLRAVVVTEEVLPDVITDQRYDESTNHGQHSILMVLDTPNAERVTVALKRRFPKANVSKMRADGVVTTLAITLEAITISDLRQTPMGLNPDVCKDIKNAGLTVVGRLTNPPAVTTAYVDAALTDAQRAGMQVFMPLGVQTLGRRDSLDALIDGLKARNIPYATPEFAKIGGDEEVVEKAYANVIRLHAAQLEELDKLPPAEVVDRYARAARERGQRILLLRPISNASESPIASIGKLVHDVAQEVEKQGSELGKAHPIADPGVPRPVYPLLGLLIAPVAWCASRLLWKPGRNQQILGVLLALAGVACYMPSARGPVALLAGLSFPFIGFLMLDEKSNRSVFVNYAILTLVSVAGGLCVAGLLSQLPYLVHAKQFLGVKMAISLPVLAVGVYFFAREAPLLGSLKSPVTWMQILLGLLVLAALAMLITRTGNDNPATVSSLELKMRAILDAILFVRPRTKEFAMGHPALIVGLFMFAYLRSGKKVPQGFAGWTALALMVGAIGQTGVLNTLCHIHSPVALELERVAVGWAVGGLLGWALWLVAKRWILPRNEQIEASTA